MIKKQKYFLCLPLRFSILEIVSTFPLYFSLQTIRRFFESHKQKADIAGSWKEVDVKSQKNRRAVRRHKVSTYNSSK